MSIMAGWAWYGRYVHVLRGSEIVRTFRGPFARRRAEEFTRWVGEISRG